MGKVLIALNPFKQLNEVPSHIYTLADEALKYVATISQAIVIMGESGAGKTETTNIICRHILQSNIGSHGENKLIDALIVSGPILERFGNSKSPKNCNSSRYCKFIKVSFNAWF